MLRKPSDVYENKVNLRTRRGFPSIVHVYNSRLPFFVNTDIEHSPSEQQCDIILENCRGLDKTRVVDDQGGLPKTVSCENSFRRGTLCSMKGVWVALGQLFDRLPRLLKDRTSWSKRPDSAYPLTIRLTARVVDECLRSTKRRPFVTRSAQCRFDGQRLLHTKDLKNQSEMIKNAVIPLVRQLLGGSSTKDVDVTRLNIAVTSFQDIPELFDGAKDDQSSSKSSGMS